MNLTESLNTSTHTSTYMTSKNITITKEAYNFLKGIKGEKSFSKTILSLRKETKSIMQFAGSLKKADLKSIEKIREEINNDWNNRN